VSAHEIAQVRRVGIHELQLEASQCTVRQSVGYTHPFVAVQATPLGLGVGFVAGLDRPGRVLNRFVRLVLQQISYAPGILASCAEILISNDHRRVTGWGTNSNTARIGRAAVCSAGTYNNEVVNPSAFQTTHMAISTRTSRFLIEPFEALG
jgi:hypothetical protein